MRFIPTKLKLKKILSLLLVSIGVVLLFIFNRPQSHHWQYLFSANLGTASPVAQGAEIVSLENRLIINSENHHTYAIDEQTGEVEWTFQAQDHAPFPVTVTPNCLILSSFAGHISCLDQETGLENWRHQLPNTLPDTPAILSTDQNRIFVGTRKGDLIALELATGAVIWEQHLGTIDNSKSFATPPIHFGQIAEQKGILFVVHSPSQTLQAFNSDSGELLWKVAHFQPTLIKPIFVDNYVIFRSNNQIVSVDQHTGKTTRLELAPTNSQEIAVISVADVGLIVQDSQNLRLVLPDLTKQIWQVPSLPLQRRFFSDSTPIIFSQSFNLQQQQTTLNFLDVKTGSSIRTHSLSTTPFTTHLQTPHLLLLGNSVGQLLAFDLLTQTPQFELNLNFKIHSITLVESGYLVALSKPGNHLGLVLVDWTGRELWRYSPEFLVNLNNLYVFNRSALFTDQTETLLERLPLSKKLPQPTTTKPINFVLKNNFDREHPSLERILIKKQDLMGKKSLAQWRNVISHFQELFSFAVETQTTNDIQQILIHHPDRHYLNPALDVKITAEAINQQTKTKLKLNGYYARNNQWQVNFLPPVAGNYLIKLKVRTPLAWHREEINLEVNQTNSNPLTVTDGQLVDAQQHLFMPLGIEDAFMGWDYNGDALDQVAASNLVQPTTDQANYRFQNFTDHLDTFFPATDANFYRYGVGNTTPVLAYQFADGKFIPSLVGASFGDRLVTALKEKKIRIMMTIFDFQPPYDTTREIANPKNQQALRAYLDYVVARYSAFVDIWEIGNEVQSSPQFYQFVTNYLRQIDPYQHPITTNWEEPTDNNFNLLSLHHYGTPTASPAQLANSFSMLKKSAGEKPIIISELGYKDFSWFDQSSLAVRYLSWLGNFEGLGLVFWSQGQNGVHQNPDNANVYLGPKEKSYLLALQQFLPELVAPVKRSQFLLPDSQIKVYAVSDQQHLLYYLLNLSGVAERTYFTFPVPAGTEVDLVDPRTNKVLSNFKTGFDQENILLPAFAEDLAIKVYLQANVL